jgi:thiol:disulfide interchange protein
MKRLVLMAGLVIATAWAAEDPVQWTFAFDAKSVPPGGHALGKLTAAIDSGWHLYSLTTPPGGPNPTSIKLAENPAVASFKVYQPTPERKFDQGFQMDTETFASKTVFLIDVEFKKEASAGPQQIEARARYQVCTSQKCLPPRTKTAIGAVTLDAAATVQAVSIPVGYLSPGAGPGPTPQKSKPAGQSFGWFLLTAFGFGIAAIFTPCVFPMIPITVSYFLNRQGAAGPQGRRDGLTQAIVFCLGIIVLFTSLGLLAKAVAGPFGVVQLGSSPWVNGFIAVVFVIFGLSLLGAFELTLPSGMLTKMSSASQRGGYVGTLIMGLTFSLTSFACVGPIVGPLLVASVQGEGLQPVFGMLSFASGLATPFFLLALFPSVLQSLPKRGMWMARIKVVLGFVILAAALKYLSNVDQVLQLGFITRERFLAAWVVLFAMGGIYLLGLLRLEGTSPEDHLGVGRTIAGAAFLAFALSLAPGMWGARLGEIDAYVPPATSQAGIGGAAAETAIPWMKDQYREALARARQENKLVFVNFTGAACTNCHWMEANMLSRPEIASLVKDFVPALLFTDRSDDVSQQNQALEEKKFGTVAKPFYAIIDADEKVIATFPGLTRNAQEFVSFLKPSRAASRPGA